jgi:hypothetical protein
VTQLSSTQLHRLKESAIFEGQGFPKIRHLRPPAELKVNMTLWTTRCGLKWPERRWYEVMGFLDSDSPQVVWCEACLAQAGIKLAPRSDELYEQAVREWIAGGIRGRGHKATAGEISKVRFGIDHGYEGSDVTPADEPCTSISCRFHGHDHEEPIPSPAQLVVECAQIVEELRLQPA